VGLGWSESEHVTIGIVLVSIPKRCIPRRNNNNIDSMWAACDSNDRNHTRVILPFSTRNAGQRLARDYSEVASHDAWRQERHHYFPSSYYCITPTTAVSRYRARLSFVLLGTVEGSLVSIGTIVKDHVSVATWMLLPVTGKWQCSSVCWPALYPPYKDSRSHTAFPRAQMHQRHGAEKRLAQR
jgi:hypothetical protein